MKKFGILIVALLIPVMAWAGFNDRFEDSKAVLTVTLADVGTASSAWVVTPYAGVIEKFYSAVNTEVITASTGVTLEIGGIEVTGSEITIASGSAAGTVDSASPTDKRTVTAGQVIEVVCDGACSVRGGGASIGTFTIVINRDRY